MCHTYHREEEEARGDSGGTVEHDADVLTRQFNAVGRVGNQNRRQQEAYGCSQLRTRDIGPQKERERTIDVFIPCFIIAHM